MKTTITLTQDNAAFGETTEERNAETVRILRKLAQDMEASTPPRFLLPEILWDLNGNAVGTIITEE
jgi:hypothetical protein